MSYASALLNGVSSDNVRPPKPQVQQPQVQQPRVQPQKPQSELHQEAQRPAKNVGLEGNNGGNIGVWFSSDENAKRFVRILSRVGINEVASLASTCVFLDKSLSKWKELINNICCRQKISEPKIFLRIDLAEKDADVESSSVADLVTKRKAHALSDYWTQVIKQAQEARDEASKKMDAADRAMNGEPPLVITLGGGLTIGSSTEKKAPLVLVNQKDLSKTLSWFVAVTNLLKGDKSQQVPYLNGYVTLSRYGFGGYNLRIELNLPNVAEGVPTFFRYDFGDFCLKLRAATKGFSSLVDTALAKLSQAEANVLGKLLKNEELKKERRAIKFHLGRGVLGPKIPRKFHEKKLNKEMIKKQQATEGENIRQLLLINLPDDFEKAKEQAKRLNAEAEEQKRLDIEERERQKAEIFQARKNQELKRQNAQDGKEENVETEAKLPKQKIKKVKETDKDGFTVEKTFIVKIKDGKEEKELVQNVTKEADSAEVKKKTKTSNDASVLAANPFSAVLKEGAFASINEIQYKKCQEKVKDRLLAEERLRAKANKERREAAAIEKKAAPTGKQTQKQTQTQKNQTQNQKQTQKQTQTQKNQPQKQEAPKPAPVQTAPKQQPAPKKVEAKKQPKPKPANKKQQKQKPKPQQKQQQVGLTEHELFQPSIIALAVVGFVTVGYYFLFNAPL